MEFIEFSGSLIVRNQKILLIREEEHKHWNIPTGKGERGELSADVAARITEEQIGVECEILRYKKQMKTIVKEESKHVTWHPYVVEIEGEPQEGEWTPIKEIEEKELSPLLEQNKDVLRKKI